MFEVWLPLRGSTIWPIEVPALPSISMPADSTAQSRLLAKMPIASPMKASLPNSTIQRPGSICAGAASG